MTDEPTRTSDDERGEPVSTPFDNPYFLPVLLWLFAVWFGYDAFFNFSEKMQQPVNLWFNRIGFPIVLLLAIYFTVKGLREKREEAERGAGDAPVEPEGGD